MNSPRAAPRVAPGSEPAEQHCRAWAVTGDPRAWTLHRPVTHSRIIVPDFGGLPSRNAPKASRAEVWNAAESTSEASLMTSWS